MKINFVHNGSINVTALKKENTKEKCCGTQCFPQQKLRRPGFGNVCVNAEFYFTGVGWDLGLIKNIPISGSVNLHNVSDFSCRFWKKEDFFAHQDNLQQRQSQLQFIQLEADVTSLNRVSQSHAPIQNADLAMPTGRSEPGISHEKASPFTKKVCVCTDDKYCFENETEIGISQGCQPCEMPTLIPIQLSIKECFPADSL